MTRWPLARRLRMPTRSRIFALLNSYQERLSADARYRRDLARRRLFTTVILCGSWVPSALCSAPA